MVSPVSVALNQGSDEADRRICEMDAASRMAWEQVEAGLA
jgi:hypothetical protein